jgi:RNA polymerase sigma-70 factor, ECF subfamily
MGSAVIRSLSLLFTRSGASAHSWTEVERSAVEPPALASETVAKLALEAIYDEHLDFVWRSLHRLGVPPGALDDAAQDVFLVVHRKIADFERRSSLRTWLFGIAVHVAREHARRARKHGPPVEVPPELPDENALDPLEQTERREQRDLLYALLAELDDDKRAVFILAEIEGVSVVDIAEGLGINANTVASRVRIARQKFESALRRFRAREAFTKGAR